MRQKGQGSVVGAGIVHTFTCPEGWILKRRLSTVLPAIENSTIIDVFKAIRPSDRYLTPVLVASEGKAGALDMNVTPLAAI